MMAPFKPFLSPKTKFYWDDELDAAFEKSKKALIAAIEHGVQIFDPKRKTCLSPDWSKTGIGTGCAISIVSVIQRHLTAVLMDGRLHWRALDS